MNSVAIDTSVLLAIFKGEPSGEAWLDCLQSASEAASLVVSSVVLAEVRSFFPSDEACRKAISDLEIRHSAMSEEAAILAGRIFRNYRKQGGPRTTILPDFLVAAHAAIQAGALATVDRGYLRAYFPKVRLLFPELPCSESAGKCKPATRYAPPGLESDYFSIKAPSAG